MYYDSLRRRVEAAGRAARHRREAQESAGDVDILSHIAPVYHGLHADIEAGAHQYYRLPGGRGSGKSSFVSLEIVNGIMKDPTGQTNAIVFRRTAVTMRESVYSQIAWAIDTLGVNGLWRGAVSPMSWTYLPTGAQIIFRGLDDASKLKSIKPKRGIFRYVWIEEFSELPGENFTRSIMQSVIRGGEDFRVFQSFNPPQSKANWANAYAARPDPRAVTLHTSYLDIPAEWLGQDFIIEAERLKEINETAYKHEYLGEATGTGGEVFPNLEIREITDAEIQLMQYIYVGLDFGFSVDPCAVLKIAFDSKTDTIYLLDEIYKKHCSNKELAALIKQKGMDKATPASCYYSFIDRRTIENRQHIVADCAELKSIHDLQSEGLNVSACRKFPGCVLYRIRWLQNRRIIIDPARTPNAHRELTQYEYARTKDGEFLADVPDENNHLIDALSYACDGLIYKKGFTA